MFSTSGSRYDRHQRERRTPSALNVHCLLEDNIGVNASGIALVPTANIWPPGSISGLDHNSIYTIAQLILWVGAVVTRKIYSGAVTCSRDNTRHQYPEMLSFYPNMHQMRLVAGLHSDPAGEQKQRSSTPPLAGLKGRGKRKRSGRRRKGEERGRTPNVWIALTPLEDNLIDLPKSIYTTTRCRV